MKKIIVMILIFALPLIMTACGGTYKEKEEKKKNNIIEWQDTLKYDHKDKVEYNIDAKIELPVSNEINMYYVKNEDIISDGFVGNFLDCISDGNPVYYADIRFGTREEINDYLEFLKNAYKSLSEFNNNYPESFLMEMYGVESKEALADRIKEFEGYLDNATDEERFEPAVDFTKYTQYKTTIDNLSYNIDFGKNGPELMLTKGLDKIKPEELNGYNEIMYRECMEKLGETGEKVEDSAGENAKKTVKNMLDKMNLNIMICTACEPIIWQGCNVSSSGEIDSKSVYKGEIIRCNAMIDGKKIYDKVVDGYEENKDCFAVPQMAFYLCDGNLLSINSYYVTKQYNVESEQKVKILDFDKIKGAFINEIEDNWEKYRGEESWQTYNIENVELSYVFSQNEEKKEGYLIPCYAFELKYKQYYTNDKKLYVMINAIDGSVIYE